MSEYSMRKCNRCGSFSTERADITWFDNQINEVRVCNDCPAQFMNVWTLDDSEVHYRDRRKYEVQSDSTIVERFVDLLRGGE